MFEELYEAAKTLLRSRKRAYEEVFNKESVDVQIVLKDLAKFCRATEPTFHMDARAHALAEGRREVWLHINKYVNVPLDDLWELTRKDQ